ncbi:CRISPR-associated protein GSU0053/csb1, Dpsyc system [Actinomyces bovis]|uniref:CRISPR-associated protein GSU0053/csb1, Dpsyc system n=1 Tax=Actinomyces bovis TaxID=1658 RepID=A0ABY1VTW6_9ACTO|nr:type I-U CRISPR-associated RAMP protein Csb1/Cas7u [Actinomyces bovis]SPT55025.1 CRISPR-associated protein GSU0053/csb1, Dpsyc system [Actinomyces bovis]VEG56170.1 CRISPR-associated protein GSU0053/csb1, Dpsyc system [Actinomyces israelii]
MSAVHVITLKHLQAACSPGGASVLTSVTKLEPAAGPHASVAPAKFSARGNSVFAYERRFYDGAPVNVVLIDSKQSQNNRGEAAIATAIADGDPILSRIPRIELVFPDGASFTDLDLPHRAFDGQIRAGAINGKSVTAAPEYRSLRDATVTHARPLLERSPMTLLLGGWDASRKSHQGRYRSILVGEIIGILADQEGAAEVNQSKRGGARIDPLGMHIDLPDKQRKAIADAQKAELSRKTYDGAVGPKGKPSNLGLGGIPPMLEQLGGVSCREIIRSHVLSFAALRALRFDSVTPQGDVACRMVLAALALNALARSDAELLLRANCDLVEAGPAVVTLDKRYGEKEEFSPLTIEQAQELLSEAIAYAEKEAGLVWDGSVLRVDGNPDVQEAAGDADRDEDA